MTAPIKPPLKKAFGTDGWGFCTAIADLTAPKIATELNATGSFNLSCSLFGDQAGLTGTTNKVTLPQLLCETVTFESNGATSYSMSDMVISFDPQAPVDDPGKAAWAALVDNLNGFLWERQGVTSSTDLVAGDFLNIIPVQLGVKIPGKTTTDAAGVYMFTQAVSVTSAPSFNVACVA